MKPSTRSGSIGLRLAVLVGMIAAGCGGDDNRGIGLSKLDGGVFDAVTGLGGQAGSTSPQGGTAGAGGGVQEGGSTGAGGVAGAKSTGGVVVSGGTTGSGGAMGGGTGGADAAVDVSTFDGAGKLDGAADAGPRDATTIETSAVPDSSVAVDGNVTCGPVCDIYCSYGNVLDANGCPTCACNVQPPSCPARKCTDCPRGYLRNSDGCLTCTCVPDPSLPCDTFQDVSLCSASTHCRWLEPGCGLFSSNDISASDTGCYEAANCTQNGDCSKAGTTCVQRTVNPNPPFRGGDFCNIAVSVCL